METKVTIYFHHLPMIWVLLSDNLNSGDVGFTYFHETLGQKSFTDHFFVNLHLLPLLQNFKIIERGANLSDHLPIPLCLSIPGRKLFATDGRAKNTVREFRWDKADLSGYLQKSGTLLNSIVHDFSCLQCDMNCENKNCLLDIDIYHSEIAHCLMEAARC